MKLPSSKTGFSLIEIIIAFSILTVTVVASTNLISTTIQNSQENVLRTQAYFLAQEGIELVRAQRDTLAMTNIDGIMEKLKVTVIDFNKDKGIQIHDSNSSQLYLNNNQFVHVPSDSLSSSDESPFSREITIENTNFNYSNLDSVKPHTRKITSTVKYEFAGNTKEISITTFLTDWKLATL